MAAPIAIGTLREIEPNGWPLHLADRRRMWLFS